MSDHLVASYDIELRDLRQTIAEMGGLCEKMLAESLQSMTRRDTAMAQRVIGSDTRLDTLQRDLEDRAIIIIARRQPMAVDLREIVSSMRIAADLERIGDLSKNVAKRVMAVNGQISSPSQALVGLEHMSDMVATQLRNVLDAFTQNDLDGAMKVWRSDDAIDALYTSLFRELLTYMMEDPRNITTCTHLLFCAKNIERIGDHTTNIAETIHFLITGTALNADRPKSDASHFATVEAVA